MRLSGPPAVFQITKKYSSFPCKQSGFVTFDLAFKFYFLYWIVKEIFFDTTQRKILFKAIFEIGLQQRYLSRNWSTNDVLVQDLPKRKSSKQEWSEALHLPSQRYQRLSDDVPPKEMQSYATAVSQWEEGIKSGVWFTKKATKAPIDLVGTSLKQWVKKGQPPPSVGSLAANAFLTTDIRTTSKILDNILIGTYVNWDKIDMIMQE